MPESQGGGQPPSVVPRESIEARRRPPERTIGSNDGFLRRRGSRGHPRLGPSARGADKGRETGCGASVTKVEESCSAPFCLGWGKESPGASRHLNPADSLRRSRLRTPPLLLCRVGTCTTAPSRLVNWSVDSHAVRAHDRVLLKREGDGENGADGSKHEENSFSPGQPPSREATRRNDGEDHRGNPQHKPKERPSLVARAHRDGGCPNTCLREPESDRRSSEGPRTIGKKRQTGSVVHREHLSTPVSVPEHSSLERPSQRL